MTGRISDECFAELSADYKAEQKPVKTCAAELQTELANFVGKVELPDE